MANQIVTPMSAKEFQVKTGINDETMERLAAYRELVVKWRGAVNLIGPATVKDIWRRHMLDSAQILPHLPPNAEPVLDIGSGGGFPGLVLAVIGGLEVHLVESNSRKCAFLRQAARATSAPAVIHESRIEDMEPFIAGVITARATAPLEKLLGYAEPFMDNATLCLFLKGRNHDRELTDSEKNWIMETVKVKSLTDRSGVILKLKRISRRDH
ncbi:MAG: 16S rRNA (guanine(527)-N(7))-methyltransferase RsmG [Rhodospirillales bacterium]